MEKVNQCILCGSATFALVFSGQDMLHKLGGEFRLVQCQQCGLYFLETRPNGKELELYYPDNYLAFQKINSDESKFQKIDKSFAITKKYFAVMDKVRFPGRILDVGCATGLLLRRFKEKGWEAFGVETSEIASKYANETLGLSVRNVDLLESNFEDNFFDVVTYWDVLEHLKDPLSSITETKRIL